jgi:ribonuclease HII
MEKSSVKEIAGRFLKSGVTPSDEELRRLEEDGRSGVRRIALSIRKRLQKKEAERKRTEKMLTHERELWGRGVNYVAGIDEVGVGPFAGPVVAAAVIFPRNIEIEGIRDSKKLNHSRRVTLERRIRETALALGIGIVDVDEIDRINILNAAFEAMRKALFTLSLKAHFVLVDGRNIPGIGIPQKAVVSGDERIFSIAAASIVAKVYRDNLMCDYDREFPQYGFAKHKGYGTLEHIRALKRFGPCTIHRRSFDWRRGGNGRNN